MRSRPFLMFPLVSIAVLLVAVASGPSVASAGGVARVARHISVNENVSTHLVQHHRTKLNEYGSGSGTFNCAIKLDLNLTSNSATISFTASPHGGSFVGSGTASVHYIGTVATFKGTIAISHGTGSYSHASGNGLRITGSVGGNNYAIKAQVTGSMSM
jgi:hypothetical protein